MLENIKHILLSKSIDKNIQDNDFETALEKLNYLVKEEFKPAETFLKRGMLCAKLLMTDDAYSDFTYIITHCAEKLQAYYQRMHLNFEISNYVETISDALKILETEPENIDCKRLIFLSYVFLGQFENAKSFVLNCFENNKYKALHFLFNETAKFIAEDELAKALKILEIIDIIDRDNPIKILKEANIYGLAGDKEKENELIKKIDSAFPKYFISHFRFTDMYEDRDLLEISFLLELKVFDRQNSFAYPMYILEGYKKQMEGHILDSKEAFEKAIEVNPKKPEAFVLLAQTLQLMSGYDNPKYKQEAEINYRIAMQIYEKENLSAKAEDMKRQIKHLNSTLSF